MNPIWPTLCLGPGKPGFLRHNVILHETQLPEMRPPLCSGHFQKVAKDFASQ